MVVQTVAASFQALQGRLSPEMYGYEPPSGVESVALNQRDEQPSKGEVQPWYRSAPQSAIWAAARAERRTAVSAAIRHDSELLRWRLTRAWRLPLEREGKGKHTMEPDVRDRVWWLPLITSCQDE